MAAAEHHCWLPAGQVPCCFQAAVLCFPAAVAAVAAGFAEECCHLQMQQMQQKQQSDGCLPDADVN
jgi:hypothetical protein